jgi:hypothetical protein
VSFKLNLDVEFSCVVYKVSCLLGSKIVVYLHMNKSSSGSYEIH